MTNELEERVAATLRGAALRRVPEARTVPLLRSDLLQDSGTKAGSSAPRRSVTRWALPLTGVMVASAAIIVPFAIAGLHRNKTVLAATPLTTASCPAGYSGKAPWVPSAPTVAGASARLVPEQPPTSAVICAYGLGATGPYSATVPLSGGKVLTVGLARLASDLSKLPSAPPAGQLVCSTDSATRVNYLVGLSYPGGTEWVSSSQSPCVATANGKFASAAAIDISVARSYQAARWVSGP